MGLYSPLALAALAVGKLLDKLTGYKPPVTEYELQLQAFREQQASSPQRSDFAAAVRNARFSAAAEAAPDSQSTAGERPALEGSVEPVADDVPRLD